MAIAFETDGEQRVVTDISTSLYQAFDGRIDRRAIIELVEHELSRFAHVPIKDFVPLLVERECAAPVCEGPGELVPSVVRGPGCRTDCRAWSWLRTYRRAWLGRDVVAGLVLTALLVPQGMAYAELAGLPPVTGLYTTVLALLAYAVFGPSRILVLGPDSALGPLIAASLLPLVGAEGDPAQAVALAGMLAILIGILCIAGGLARLGMLAELLSRPVRVGFLNGIALVVIVGQLPALFGFGTDAHGLVAEARAFVEGVRDGETVAASLVVGIGSLLVIFVCRAACPEGAGRPDRGRGFERRGLGARPDLARGGGRRCRSVGLSGADVAASRRR